MRHTSRRVNVSFRSLRAISRQFNCVTLRQFVTVRCRLGRGVVDRGGAHHAAAVPQRLDQVLRVLRRRLALDECVTSGRDVTRRARLDMLDYGAVVLLKQGSR